MKRLPQRTRAHVLEEESRKFIENKFPSEWIISRTQTDYGIDFQVEIVENQKVTGAHFLIQLKAKDKIKLDKYNNILHNEKTSRIQYFLERTELVVYIVYSTTVNRAYWLWIQDYVNNKISENKLSQKSITIKIPNKNILNKENISLIKERVVRTHKNGKILTNIQTLNDESYDYFFKTSGKRSSISLIPKHPNALQDSPIELEGLLKFDNTPEDRKLYEKFKRSIKTGSPVKLNAKNFEISKFPKQFSKLLNDSENFDFKYMMLKSSRSNEIFPSNIKLLDKEDNILYEIAYIEFKKIQAGEEEFTFSNRDENKLLNIKLILNKKSHNLAYSFAPNPNYNTLLEKREFINFQLAFNKSSTLKFTNLKIQQFIKLEIPSKNKGNIKDGIIPIIDKLIFIQDKTNSRIDLPDEILQNDQVTINRLNTLLETGILRIQGKKFNYLVPWENFKSYKLLLERKIKSGLFIFFKEHYVFLFEKKIPLGDAILQIPNYNLAEETINILQNIDQVPKEDSILVELEIGEPQLLTFVYKNWLPKDSLLFDDIKKQIKFH